MGMVMIVGVVLVLVVFLMVIIVGVVLVLLVFLMVKVGGSGTGTGGFSDGKGAARFGLEES